MASSKRQPYQKLVLVPRGGAIDSSFLLVASGPTLSSISLSDGTVVSQWPADIGDEADTPAQSNVSPSNEDEDQSQPKAEAGEPTPEEKTSMKQNKPSRKRKRADNPPPRAATILLVALAPSGEHAVVATQQDKSLHVLSISSTGTLTPLSSRPMPKRLSALAFTPSSSSNTTIITADKTGEVYGLPLLPAAADDETPPRPETLSRHAQLRARDGPEASTTTVHSQRNRQALEAQQRSAGKPTPRRVDDEVSRKYELQLGHVSIVTDVLFATAPSPSGGRRRGYIITADKDEHIRVSRAPPQAYVAEGFCLGHKRFVSRLCLAEEEVLASAGGEDDVFGWRWREGKLAGRVGIAGAVGEVRRRLGGKEEAEEIAVSGLWRMDGRGEDGQARMLVTVEGVPAAFYFPVSALTTVVDEPQTAEYVLLPGNPLDLICHGDTIVVSLDNVHAPGSTTVVAEGTDTPRLVAMRLDGSNVSDLTARLKEANSLASTAWDETDRDETIYWAEKLRKLPDDASHHGPES